MVSRKKRIKSIKGKVKAQARKNNREGRSKRRSEQDTSILSQDMWLDLIRKQGELEKTAFNGGLLIQNGRVETTRKR